MICFQNQYFATGQYYKSIRNSIVIHMTLVLGQIKVLVYGLPVLPFEPLSNSSVLFLFTDTTYTVNEPSFDQVKA